MRMRRTGVIGHSRARWRRGSPASSFTCSSRRARIACRSPDPVERPRSVVASSQAAGGDYCCATVVWHNVMLTAWLGDALSSFARPGSSVRSRRLSPAGASPPPRIYRWEKTTAVAVKIKLKRLGKIREPYYRIVVADARTKRDGRAIEEIGKYHPKAEPSLIEVNSERVQHWLSVGAQPTDPVRALLKVTGDWQRFTGEAGAEGTLRTAEPRVDKRERFAAVASQSQATKEDKAAGQSKVGSGSRAARSARDGAARDGAAKEGAAKDGAAKDRVAREGAGSASAGDGAEKATRTRAAAKTAREPRGARAAQADGATASGPEAAGSADADAAANASREAQATDAAGASDTAEATGEAQATDTAEASDTAAATGTAEATGEAHATGTAEATGEAQATDPTEATG